MSVTGDLVAMRGGSAQRVYAMGAVPDKPTYPYTVIGYAPNAPTVRRLSGSGDPTERFTVQHFGKTADAVEAISTATFVTFEGRAIGDSVCWQEIATPLYRDPDDNGVLSTTHIYRF